MSGPLYSQLLTISATGILKISGIGGSGYDPDGIRQVGQDSPPRFGVLNITGTDTAALRDSRVKVTGYYERDVAECACPVEIITELPASVTIEGPPGLQLVVEAWPLTTSGDERGGRSSSSVAVGASLSGPVPYWARSFDFAGNSTVTFRDAAAAVVGVITSAVSGFSVPDRAATFDLVSTTNPSFLVFRQKG